MKSKILIPIFVLFFLATAVNAFVISGQVTDTSAVPINNSHIEVFDTTGSLINDTYTNATGDYSVEVGNLLRIVNASAVGYDTQSTPIFVNSNKTINFALGPIQAVYLSGFVTDGTNPLNNVDIKVKQGGSTFTETNTNAAGFYNVSVLDGDSYDVTASLVGYDSETSPVTINGNTELNFTLTKTPSSCTDGDGDGYYAEAGCGTAVDCDDSNPAIHPGATEVCGDGIDNDCSGGDATCSPPSSSSCFPTGTKILMENGNKNIEDVKVGDKVIGFDGSKKVTVEVLELESPVRDHMYTLNFEDGSILELTREHPVYTEQGWKSISPEETAFENSELEVSELNVGDKILNYLGEYVKIIDIDFVEKTVQTYNLKKVSEYNNFFANGFLAHNKGYDGTLYRISLTSSGVTQRLRRKDIVSFYFKGEKHEVEVTAISSSSVTLLIKSDPITAYLEEDRGGKYDLDNDDIYDLEVKVTDISFYRTTLTFFLINEPIIPPEPTLTTTLTTTSTYTPPPSKPRKQIIVEDVPETDSEDDTAKESIFNKITGYIGGVFGYAKRIPYLGYVASGLIILLIIIVAIKLFKAEEVAEENLSQYNKDELRKRITRLEKQITRLKRTI